MAHSTTALLRHQIFRLNQQGQPDLDFGLGEILPPEDLALILTEEGATWKTIIYTPLLTTWAFLWQMLSPDRSCRAAVKRIAAWLSSQGKKLANDKDDPYIKARQRLPETVPLRPMKHLGRRCHERAEAAWRWCDRTVKSVDGSIVAITTGRSGRKNGSAFTVSAIRPGRGTWGDVAASCLDDHVNI